jgi:hypothetical protein
MRALGAVGRVLGTVGDDGSARLEFARERVHSPILAEYVTIALQGTPRGEYLLRLKVTDEVGGHTFERTGQFTIR